MILPDRRNKRLRKYQLRAMDSPIAVLVITIAVWLAWQQNERVAETATPRNIIEGQTEVSDGDSLRIHGQRIRIVGIDAPELYQSCERDGRQFACGRYSTDYLRNLIGNRPVTCRWIKKDQYNRLLGHCLAGETDLNRTMVLDGWAVSYSSYPLEEREARRNKCGMWQWNVQRPRDWRRVHQR